MLVRLIAHTPDPDRVCAIAAGNCVSDNIPTGDSTQALTHALRSGHTSVAEHASFTFSVEGVSRVLETQLVRHRIGASYSIQSGRYCDREPMDYMVPYAIEPGDEKVDTAIRRFNTALKDLDDILKEKGFRSEDRRYFYPQGLTTRIIVTMNARELLDVYLPLRTCTRSQAESRELAERILELVRPVAPVLFADAGPSCVRYGRCPEGKRSCGRCHE